MGNACSAQDNVKNPPQATNSPGAKPEPKPAAAPAPAPVPAAAPAHKSAAPVAAPAPVPAQAPAPVHQKASSPKAAAASVQKDIEFEHEKQDITGHTKIREEQPDSDIDDWCVRGRAIKTKNLENADDVKNEKDFGISAGGDDMFATAEAAEGKSFMAVLPWKGAIFPPTNAPQHNPVPPAMNLKMEWVYGYRGYDARNNICIASDGQLIYPSAAVCIKYDPKTHSQSFFNGHNDDVICLAQCPSDPDLIATGQVATIVNRKATLPHICIWNAKSMTQVMKIPNAHKRAVRCVSFSPSGKFLASVGDDDNQTLTVWDVATGGKIASAPTDQDPNKLFGVTWRTDDELATVGMKHIYSWQFAGAKLDKKRMLVKGKFELQTFFSAVFTKKGYCAVTTRDGNVYVFGKNEQNMYECVKAVHEHAGAVFGICTRDNGGLITCGKDGKVVIWSSQLKVDNTYNFNNTGVRAVYVRGKRLLVGTEACELHEIADYEAKAQAEPRVWGHSDGELWGLDASPINKDEFATAGEDNKVVIWNAAQHKLVKMTEVSAKPGERRKRERASTMSSQPANRCARCAVYSPNGEHLAVGTNEGELVVFDVKQMTPIVVRNLNEFAKQNLTKKWGNWIQCMKYSPDGQVLAVGTHGSVIVLCEVNKEYAPAAKLAAHNAPLTHLDFSADGQHIQSVCRAYELLFHNVKTPLADSAQNPNPSQLCDVKWKTQTCILGWGVQGIFDPQQDGTDVNCVDLSPDGTTVATGDDYGYINLFRYPVLTNCEHKIYTGHSSHVMNVKFTPDQKRLFTVGGNDKTIIQWVVC